MERKNETKNSKFSFVPLSFQLKISNFFFHSPLFFPRSKQRLKENQRILNMLKYNKKVNLLRRGCEHHHKQWPLGFGRGTRGRRRVSIANPSCQDPILPKSPFPHNATNLFPEALRLRWWSFKKFRRHICPERKKWMVEKGEEGGCWGEEES